MDPNRDEDWWQIGERVGLEVVPEGEEDEVEEERPRRTQDQQNQWEKHRKMRKGTVESCREII